MTTYSPVTETIPEYVVMPYINRVGAYLDRFKQLSSTVYNFRCPYCGDSQRNKSKCRAYIYKRKGEYMMKCHNCGKVTGIRNFIKDVSQSLADELRLDVFKASGRVARSTVPDCDDDFTKFKVKITTTTSDILHTTHLPLTSSDVPSSVVEYAHSRKLPVGELYYCENIINVLMLIDKYRQRLDENPECYNHLLEFESVCIPYYDHNNTLTHLQYRFIGSDKFRFLTVEVADSLHKVWGLHKAAKDKLVYVFEGAFDAMMVENGVAVAQGDLSRTYSYLTELGYDCVLVHDNDYCSNKQINKQVQNSIKSGAKVVIYDSNFKEKDANKMLCDHNWTTEELREYFVSRTYIGLKAKLELTKQCSLNKPVI